MRVSADSVDVFSLPSVYLRDSNKLPAGSGIYFVVGNRREFVYIGKSGNLRTRVSQHEKKEKFYSLCPSPVVHYLEVERLEEIGKIEVFFIKKFKPALNISAAESKTYKGKRTRSVTIDPEIWDVIEAQAGNENISVNKWFENYFLKHLKKQGLIKAHRSAIATRIKD